MNQRAIVGAWVDAARRVACRPGIVEAIAVSSGLSREGVRLALAEHTEPMPDEAQFAALVGGIAPASAVHVILSSTVFVAALRAIVLARLATAKVTVRPSSRDPAYAEALVFEARDPCVTLATRGSVRDVTEGEIHVYGSNPTIQAVRGAAPPSVVVRAHANGFGVAVATLPEDAEAIARDVVPFDQRGCLSPRWVFVLGDATTLGATAGRLAEALAAWEHKVPLGARADEALRWRDTVACVGGALVGARREVGLLAEARLELLPPTGRHLGCSAVASVADLAATLRAWSPSLTCVGAAHEIAEALRPRFPHVRWASLGRMQQPPLDGPVDLRDL